MDVSLSDFLLSDMGLGRFTTVSRTIVLRQGGGTLSSGDEIAARPCYNVTPFYNHSSYFIENILKKAHET